MPRRDDYGNQLNMGDRLGDLDGWLLARLRVVGALRDEPVTQTSGYRQFGISGWIAAWTEKRGLYVRNAIRSARTQIESEAR